MVGKQKMPQSHRTLMGKDGVNIPSRTECDHLVPEEKEYSLRGFGGIFLAQRSNQFSNSRKLFPLSPWK